MSDYFLFLTGNDITLKKNINILLFTSLNIFQAYQITFIIFQLTILNAFLIVLTLIFTLK